MNVQIKLLLLIYFSFSHYFSILLSPSSSPSLRRLCKNQSIHHAIHLAAIRKACEQGNGLDMIKVYLRQVPSDLAIIESIAFGTTTINKNDGDNSNNNNEIVTFQDLDTIAANQQAEEALDMMPDVASSKSAAAGAGGSEKGGLMSRLFLKPKSTSHLA